MSLISSLVCALLFGGGYAKSVVGHVGLILIITVGVSLKDASPFPKCLADQQGTRIDAIIPPIQYKKYFKRYLMEGEWYLMTNFQLIDPPKKIRNSDVDGDIAKVGNVTIIPYVGDDYEYPNECEILDFQLRDRKSLNIESDPFQPPEENEEILGPEVPYLSAIGALMYLANCTRPDISFSSGCCKPPTACGYNFVNPTLWLNPTNMAADADCYLWSNDQSQLCYNCNSCKAGLLGNLRKEWRKANLILIITVVVLIWVYVIACSAFRNAQTEDLFRKYKQGVV
ncbi:hypothetical protein ISN44_As08g038720 [Arabidopsis suecica]|uniref:Replication protein A 70 kDa DNA-binding subunit B/D first OB fold domain-containing protein n=1 Tax=Arabidopsis suecica TaxID=45249 RepID=A0A8T2BG06_ARASU|nr:hypothetical protein ISN44_As08g038720 [Arabidopsis suecica]